MAQLNINCNRLKGYANRLQELRKSALPLAVLKTLNDAAFDVKTKTMPESASKSFVQRKKTFFQANSRVETAKRGSISVMKSTVGFIPKDKAVKELEQQEKGGKIGGRSFVTTKHARTSNNWKQSVRPKARTSSIKNLINADESKGANDKEKFIRAAIHAGKGGNVLAKNNKGQYTLSQIRSLKQQKIKKRGRRMIVKTVPLYSYKKGRSVNVTGTNFMSRASKKSAEKLEPFFYKNATQIINKYSL